MNKAIVLILATAVFLLVGCGRANEPHLPPISGETEKPAITATTFPSPEVTPEAPASPETEKAEGSVVLGGEDTPDLGKLPIERKEVIPKPAKSQKPKVVLANKPVKLVEPVRYEKPAPTPTPAYKTAVRERWVKEPVQLAENQPPAFVRDPVESNTKKGFPRGNQAFVTPSPEPVPYQREVPSEPDTGCAISTDRHWYVRYQGQWIQNDAYCKEVVIDGPNRRVRQQQKKRCGFWGSVFKSDCP